MDSFLRFCATMFVLLLHGKGYITNLKYTSEIFQIIAQLPAWAGVWIFFFLSGYGIGIGFETDKYSLFNENGVLNLKSLLKFYVLRFIKIAPLYYCYCIIFEIVSGGTFFYTNPDKLIRLLTFTFNGNGGVSGLGHLWYVSIVMQLYIILPFIYLLIKKVNSHKLITILLILTFFIGCGLRLYLYTNEYDWYTYIYTNVFTNLDLAIAGILTAKVNVANKPFYWKNPYKLLSMLLFVGLVLFNCFIYKLATPHCLLVYRCILPSFYLIICALLLIIWNKKDNTNKYKKILPKFFSFISKFSYGIYIYQFIVFFYLKKTLMTKPFYETASGYTQYISFFTCALLLSILLTRIFTKGSEFITLRKKKKGLHN